MSTPRTVLGVVGAALCSLLASDRVPAQQPGPTATIAIVGDADRFNIGQGSYCSKRAEIESPRGVSFDVPAARRTWFFVRSTYRTPTVFLACEGEYSFVPEAGQLHIIRFSDPGATCTVELFRGRPGDTPAPAELQPEERRSCIGQ